MWRSIASGRAGRGERSGGRKKGGQKAPAVEAMQIGSGIQVFCLLPPVRGARAMSRHLDRVSAPAVFGPESANPRRRERMCEKEGFQSRVSLLFSSHFPFSSLSHFGPISFPPLFFSITKSARQNVSKNMVKFNLRVEERKLL